jgi:hypothetical protein
LTTHWAYAEGQNYVSEKYAESRDGDSLSVFWRINPENPDNGVVEPKVGHSEP